MEFNDDLTNTSRRDFARLALAGLTVAGSAASASETKINGVRIAIGSYTFRTMPLDDMIKVLIATNSGSLELDSLFLEPAPAGGPAPRGGRGATEQRETLRKWRLTVPLDEFKATRKKLNKAGIAVTAYFVPVNDTFTDEEIDRAFLMAKALGTDRIHSSTNVTSAKRIIPIATKHKMFVGLHPSGNPTSPDSIGTGASYEKLFEMSPYVMANFDLSGYKNWGPDPLAFVKQHNKRISSIHFHDRRTTGTPQAWVPFGEGDMPMKELLLMVKKEKFKFNITIERMYTVPNLDQTTEMKRCLDYCRKVLSA